MTLHVLFDKLTYVDRLKAAGVDEAQARAHAEGLEQAFREEVATKTDLNDGLSAVRREIEAVRGEIEAVRGEIKEAKFQLLQWIIGAIGFQTVVIVGALVTLTKLR
jgi:hypothetical protein